MMINLKDNVLQLEGASGPVSVPFLSEAEVRGHSDDRFLPQHGSATPPAPPAASAPAPAPPVAGTPASVPASAPTPAPAAAATSTAPLPPNPPPRAAGAAASTGPALASAETGAGIGDAAPPAAPASLVPAQLFDPAALQQALASSAAAEPDVEMNSAEDKVQRLMGLGPFSRVQVGHGAMHVLLWCQWMMFSWCCHVVHRSRQLWLPHRATNKLRHRSCWEREVHVLFFLLTCPRQRVQICPGLMTNRDGRSENNVGGWCNVCRERARSLRSVTCGRPAYRTASTSPKSTCEVRIHSVSSHVSLTTPHGVVRVE